MCNINISISEIACSLHSQQQQKKEREIKYFFSHLVFCVITEVEEWLFDAGYCYRLLLAQNS